jgi:DMSO/TMAO reductase YedYZ molybdopterin-dependent catalytic subunit
MWQKRAADPEIRKRIPPGQVLTEKFPVLHFGRTPEYPDLSAWDLRVFGEVEMPFSLRWAEVRALPARDVRLDIHCVTRWSKLDTDWQGVPISHLAEVAQLKPTARFVVLHAEYGFTSNVPLDVALQPDAICAWSFAGAPLEADHGYPLRAVIPGKYFWKSAKWLRGIEFTADDRLGFWERNGYHNDADPWREERYSG